MQLSVQRSVFSRFVGHHLSSTHLPCMGEAPQAIHMHMVAAARSSASLRYQRLSSKHPAPRCLNPCPIPCSLVALVVEGVLAQVHPAPVCLAHSWPSNHGLARAAAARLASRPSTGRCCGRRDAAGCTVGVHRCVAAAGARCGAVVRARVGSSQADRRRAGTTHGSAGGGARWRSHRSGRHGERIPVPVSLIPGLFVARCSRGGGGGAGLQRAAGAAPAPVPAWGRHGAPAAMQQRGPAGLVGGRASGLGWVGAAVAPRQGWGSLQAHLVEGSGRAWARPGRACRQSPAVLVHASGHAVVALQAGSALRPGAGGAAATGCPLRCNRWVWLAPIQSARADMGESAHARPAVGPAHDAPQRCCSCSSAYKLHKVAWSRSGRRQVHRALLPRARRRAHAWPPSVQQEAACVLLTICSRHQPACRSTRVDRRPRNLCLPSGCRLPSHPRPPKSTCHVQAAGRQGAGGGGGGRRRRRRRLAGQGRVGLRHQHRCGQAGPVF